VALRTDFIPVRGTTSPEHVFPRWIRNANMVYTTEVAAPDVVAVVRSVVRQASEEKARAILDMNPAYWRALAELRSRVAANDPGEILSPEDSARELLA
jgi:hypothetical protein